MIQHMLTKEQAAESLNNCRLLAQKLLHEGFDIKLGVYEKELLLGNFNLLHQAGLIYDQEVQNLAGITDQEVNILQLALAFQLNRSIKKFHWRRKTKAVIKS